MNQILKMKKFRVGLDNYCLFSKNLMPDELINWASVNGAEGIAFSGFNDEMRENFTIPYLHDVRQQADDLGFYLEWGNGQHIPTDMTSWGRKEIFANNRKAVGEAYALGVKIVRSCSGGLMRWKQDSPLTETFLKETATELKTQAAMFRDNGVILAIETHFEFTTFELLRLFEMCETVPGDYLGICLDTMNLLTMLEDPSMATDRVLPWVVSTHIKDGGIRLGDEGITTFPAAIGKGIIDLDVIIRKIASPGKDISLSVEDHGGSFLLPVNESWFINRFPDIPVAEYNSLLEMAEKSAEKMLISELKITDRAVWPSICEERTKENIRNLKLIRDRIN
jgi:sugar phosphate isomerase/epimerase